MNEAVDGKQSVAPDDTRRLRLAHREPLAVGRLRCVYQHPSRPDCVIKTVRADAIGRRWGPAAPWYKRFVRTRQYTVFARELNEYLAVHALHPGSNPPIARLLGIEETDLGLGLVAGKVRDDHGAMAPTVAALCQDRGRIEPWLDAALAAFLDALLDHGVIVGDLHAWNIVHGTDARGGPRLVLVDGFGEKNFIPRNSLSARTNARHTRRLYERMRGKLANLATNGNYA
jgi:hypothetical protein